MASARAKVMLVDDQADFMELVSFWFQTKGYQVTKADGGAKALEILKREPHDILFLDVNMPDMNGIETLQRLREFNPALPVVMLTAAHEDEAGFDKFRALGINGIFAKDSNLLRLGEVIDDVLKGGSPPAPR